MAEFAMWRKPTNSKGHLRARRIFSLPNKKKVDNRAKWVNWTHIATTLCFHIFLNLLSHLVGDGGFYSDSFEYILLFGDHPKSIHYIPYTYDGSIKFLENLISFTWYLIPVLKSGQAQTRKANKCSRNGTSKVELFQILNLAACIVSWSFQHF